MSGAVVGKIKDFRNRLQVIGRREHRVAGSDRRAEMGGERGR